MSAPPLDSPNFRFAPSQCPQSHPATMSRDKNPGSTAPVPPALPKISPTRSPPDSPEHRCRAGSARSRVLSPAACRDPRRASSSRVALAPEPIAPSLDRARPEPAAVDLKQHLPLLHRRAFAIRLRDDVSRHLRLNLRVVESIQRRDPLVINRHVFLHD